MNTQMRGSVPEASEHTPGPWRLYRRAVNHSYVVESEDVLVARMVGVNNTVTANARLIAAAPDLLAALQDMEHKFDTDPSSLTNAQCHALAVARVAITKATQP